MASLLFNRSSRAGESVAYTFQHPLKQTGDSVDLLEGSLGAITATSLTATDITATDTLRASKFVYDLKVTDRLITINHDGGVASASDSGIELEEDSAFPGHLKTDATRNSWLMKAPNTAGEITMTPGASGFTINHVPAMTFTNVGSTPNSTGITMNSAGVLNLQEANQTFAGAVSTASQAFGGVKDFKTGIKTDTITESTPAGGIEFWTGGMRRVEIDNAGGSFYTARATFWGGASMKDSIRFTTQDYQIAEPSVNNMAYYCRTQNKSTGNGTKFYGDDDVYGSQTVKLGVYSDAIETVQPLYTTGGIVAPHIGDVYYLDSTSTVTIRNGTVSAPFVSFAELFIAVPDPGSDTAEQNRIITVYCKGIFNEDVVIPARRRFLFYSVGLCVIGSGDLQYFESTTARTVDWNFNSDDETSKSRPFIAFKSLGNLESSSTHIGYENGWKISGAFTLKADAGVSPGGGGTKEFVLESCRLKTTLSSEAGSGQTNMYFNECFFDGAITGTSTLHFQVAKYCEFDMAITTSGAYNRFEYCEFNADVDIGSFSEAVPPGGFFNCKITSTTFSTAQYKFDDYTYRTFANSGTALAGGATIVKSDDPDTPVIADSWPNATAVNIASTGINTTIKGPLICDEDIQVDTISDGTNTIDMSNGDNKLTLSSSAYIRMNNNVELASGVAYLLSNTKDYSLSYTGVVGTTALRTRCDTIASGHGFTISGDPVGYLTQTGKLSVYSDGIITAKQIQARTADPSLLTMSCIGNADGLPIMADTVRGQIHAVGSGASVGTWTPSENSGCLRLSAGGGTSSAEKSGIDISGGNASGDSDNVIRFFTGGVERARINNDALLLKGVGGENADIQFFDGTNNHAILVDNLTKNQFKICEYGGNFVDSIDCPGVAVTTGGLFGAQTLKFAVSNDKTVSKTPFACDHFRGVGSENSCHRYTQLSDADAKTRLTSGHTAIGSDCWMVYLSSTDSKIYLARTPDGSNFYRFEITGTSF